MTLIDRRNRKSSGDMRQLGLLTTVPAMLLAAPLIGFFGGRWADEWFGTEPWLMVVGVILGLGSAGLETYNIIKKASSTGDQKDSEGQPRT